MSNFGPVLAKIRLHFAPLPSNTDKIKANKQKHVQYIEDQTQLRFPGAVSSILLSQKTFPPYKSIKIMFFKKYRSSNEK